MHLFHIVVRYHNNTGCISRYTKSSEIINQYVEIFKKIKTTEDIFTNIWATYISVFAVMRTIKT